MLNIVWLTTYLTRFKESPVLDIDDGLKRVNEKYLKWHYLPPKVLQTCDSWAALDMLSSGWWDESSSSAGSLQQRIALFTDWKLPEA